MILGESHSPSTIKEGWEISHSHTFKKIFAKAQQITLHGHEPTSSARPREDGAR